MGQQKREKKQQCKIELHLQYAHSLEMSEAALQGHLLEGK